MVIYTRNGKPELNGVQILIGDQKRRGVAYISAGRQPIGTAFFVQVPWGFMAPLVYAVTARHVIEDIQTAILIEVASREGGRTIRTKPEDWLRCDDSDVACYQLESLNLATGTALDIDEHFAKVPDALTVGCGSEVFIIGLFSKAPYGKNRWAGSTPGIEPIVRFGKVALPYTEAPVYFDIRDVGKEQKQKIVRAHLIESSAFGGESGSPVFLSGEHVSDVEIAVPGDQRPKEFYPLLDIEVRTPLLGMISAHWMIDATLRSRTRRKVVGDIPLNSGIAVVIPANNIKEFLMNDSKVKAAREKVSKRQAYQPTTPLSATQSVESEAFTKQDFEAALKKVSRKAQPKKPD